jgi:hypothetical protein
MTYALLASLQVGDSVQLSSASRQELFRVIAIERDVDELGTPLPGRTHPRTIRIHARRDNLPTGFRRCVFRHRGLAISATQVRRTL